MVRLPSLAPWPTKNSSVSAAIESSADEDDGYFFISEDDSEEFEVVVTYVPATDGFYRLKLQAINFNDRQSSPDTSITLNRDFQSKSVYVSVN